MNYKTLQLNSNVFFFLQWQRFWDKLRWNQKGTQMLDVTDPLFIVCLTKDTNYAFCHNWIGACFHFMWQNKHSGTENAYFAGLTPCFWQIMYVIVEKEYEWAWLLSKVIAKPGGRAIQCHPARHIKPQMILQKETFSHLVSGETKRPRF